MIAKARKILRRRFRQAKRRAKKNIYRMLCAFYTGDYHISAFYTVLGIFLFVTFCSLFLPKNVQSESVNTASVLGSELTHALRFEAGRSDCSELNADVTLLLLPEVDESTDLKALLSEPLYGFYLTGRELTYLPEFYASLPDSFWGGTPYVGGLSYTYNRYRIMYNRSTDVSLVREDGSLEDIAMDRFYYVIGNELSYTMFHYLSARSLGLISIQPKNADGHAVADYHSQLLSGKDGSCTLFDVYSSYLLNQDASLTPVNASAVSVCNSVNATALFGSLNYAGIFLMVCMALLVFFCYLLRPYMHRMYIWLRVFRVHRRKRAKVSVPLRVLSLRKKQAVFFKKLLTNRAA